MIIPAYNEENNIGNCVQQIQNVFEQTPHDYHILIVDDGSRDNTRHVAIELSEKNMNVDAIIFSRNFGKEAVIQAGFDNMDSRYDAALIIDADLQHPPEKIIEMLSYINEKYNVIECIKRDRKEQGKIYNFFAKIFYFMFQKLAGFDIHNSSDFKLLDRKSIQYILDFKERNRTFRGITQWLGFRTKQIYFDVQKRYSGKSSWSRINLLKFSLDTILNFSSIPLYLVIVTGMFFFLFGLLLSLNSLVQYYQGKSVEGFTTVNILICFSGSIIMLALGIIGCYLAKIYIEIKERPAYVIEKKNILKFIRNVVEGKWYGIYLANSCKNYNCFSNYITNYFLYN